MLSNKEFKEALRKKDFGYYPYSIEDTFELLRSETTRLEIFRVPIDLVGSYASFVASSCLRICDEKAIEALSVSESTLADLEQQLNWIESTDTPASKKYKELAVRDIINVKYIHKLHSQDSCEELMFGKTKEFYFYVLWFTTG